MNLREWAAATGVSYVTARRQYAAGALPVPTYRLGRLIMVGEPLTGAAPNTGLTVVYARVSSADQEVEHRDRKSSTATGSPASGPSTSKCAHRPNIEIRVLPFKAGAHASPAGAFKVFTMVEPYPDVAYTETPGGAIYVETPGAERFAQTYDRLQRATLTPEESAERISAAAEETT